MFEAMGVINGNGRSKSRITVEVAVIGAGEFGSGIVEQAAHAPDVRVRVVVDEDVSKAVASHHRAGVAPEWVRICTSETEARTALDEGYAVAAPNVEVVLPLDLHVIVEATGNANSGARHARDAIAEGKHVAMVTKEADAAVGPILNHLATKADLVYTPVFGDQHGLLIQLVGWARSLGLDVLCGGKLLDSEIVRLSDGRLTRWGGTIDVEPGHFIHMGESDLAPIDVVAARSQALGEKSGAKPWDIVELAIVANATGLIPDKPSLHGPALWTTEIARTLCPSELGGILDGPGRVDGVQVIRRTDELSLGGGVFVVVRMKEPLRRILVDPWSNYSPESQSALIVWPHHLLGIEALGSVIAAARSEGILTPNYQPRYDVAYETLRAMREGEEIGDDHTPDVRALMLPAASISCGKHPLPAGLASGCRLSHDVTSGQVIKVADVVPPTNSALWQLRARQDEFFGL